MGTQVILANLEQDPMFQDSQFRFLSGEREWTYNPATILASFYLFKWELVHNTVVSNFYLSSKKKKKLSSTWSPLVNLLHRQQQSLGLIRRGAGAGWPDHPHPRRPKHTVTSTGHFLSAPEDFTPAVYHYCISLDRRRHQWEEAPWFVYL